MGDIFLKTMMEKLMFSVEVTRLVETVELVNCFTVLGFEGQVKLIFRLF